MIKVFTVWLMLVYAFSATGASVHLHYCCGKLQHLTMENEHDANHDECTLCLNNHENNDNPGCDPTHHDGADGQAPGHCQNVEVDVQKTTGDHLPSSDKNLLKIQSLELLVLTLIHIVDFPLGNNSTTETANSPPRVASIALFIQHCTYRI